MLNNITNQIWAIQPSILKLYTLEEKKAYSKEEILHEEELFTSIETKKEKNILILKVDGVLEPKLSFMSFLFGGTSTLVLQQEIEKAIQDNTIDKIILELNTPGGDITGIQSLANTIYQARGKKEIIAVVKDLAVSAGYWIASACSEIILSCETAQVGSIGVVMIHKDFSEAEKKEGIKTTEIYAGKYKRIISNYKPLDNEGKNILQKKVDFLYGIFLQDVVKYRNKSIDYVLENMAEGKVFIGEQAIKSQLVDKIQLTSVDFVDNIYNNENLITAEYTKENNSMVELTEKVFIQDNPNLAKMLAEKAELSGKKLGIETGVLEERERILGINALNRPGFEKTIAKAIKEGYSIEKTGFALWQEQKERGVNIKNLVQDNEVINFKAVEEDKTEKEKEEDEEKDMVKMMVGDKKKENK